MFKIKRSENAPTLLLESIHMKQISNKYLKNIKQISKKYQTNIEQILK